MPLGTACQLRGADVSISKAAFYGDIGWRMLVSLKKAVPKAEVVSATILSTLTLFSQTWATSWTTWSGVHPAWAAVPLIAVFLHLFLKAVYDKWNEREAEHAKDIERVQESTRYVTLLQNDYQFQKAQLAEIKQAATQHADSALIGREFTPNAAAAWSSGAYSILTHTLSREAIKRYWQPRPDDFKTAPDLMAAVADYRGFIVSLGTEDLKPVKVSGIVS
jgi:hypothetical protein